MIMGRKGGW